MQSLNSEWVLIASAAALMGLAVRGIHLKKPFEGPEDHFGAEDRAESANTSDRRNERIEIVPLNAREAARFIRSWRGLQARFTSNPQNVVAQTDQLVREVMLKRGYPIGDFERRADDISLEHPEVVQIYRAAQAIAARAERGRADMAELRQAAAHYRALFDRLIEGQGAAPGDPPENQVALPS
jgi:hypothetical protein